MTWITKSSPVMTTMDRCGRVSRADDASRIRRPDPSRDLGAFLALHQRDLVLPLEVEPELRAVAEVAAEAHGGVGVDRATGVEDVDDTPRGHAEVER